MADQGKIELASTNPFRGRESFVPKTTDVAYRALHEKGRQLRDIKEEVYVGPEFPELELADYQKFTKKFIIKLIDSIIGLGRTYDVEYVGGTSLHKDLNTSNLASLSGVAIVHFRDGSRGRIDYMMEFREFVDMKTRYLRANNLYIW